MLICECPLWVISGHSHRLAEGPLSATSGRGTIAAPYLSQSAALNLRPAMPAMSCPSLIP